MTPEEMSDLYIRIAFHYESTIDRLVGKGLLDKDFVDSHRKTFYDSLDEEKLLVVCSFCDHGTSFTVPDEFVGAPCLISNMENAYGKAEMTLKPYEAFVLKR